MELLQKFKENGYFTADLYHLLANKKLTTTNEEIIPSVYEKEMKMSTTERLKNLHSIEISNLITDGGTKASKVVLSFTPKIIVFQNYKPNDRIVAKFSVMNISKAPTYLAMVYKESSYFFIKTCGAEQLSRLAPGISINFAITFTPAQYEDYIHRVTFFTDVDQYVLPLIAMGPRPVFDFPDEVIIPPIPLKIENIVFVTIRNVGKMPSGFTLRTKCPFSIKPKSAYLNPGENIDIKVSIKSMHQGSITGIMNALFETGENFSIKLSGQTYTVSVELEKEVVRFSDTYNTMVRQQTFKITNKSDHLLTYMCMKNDCIFYDFEEKVKLATIFYDLKDSETDKNRKLIEYDVLSSEEHQRVYTRIFYDEIQSLVADESLCFQNTHFSITPINGNLWPNKTTEITITFAPKEIGECSVVAFLDIDGIPERVPLKMVGNSLAPNIFLNLETLDMDCVYINKTSHYEIVAMNKGHINGVIVYKEVPVLFGSHITCTPEIHCLRPGQKEIFIISFLNSHQGPYFEEINFMIRDTNVVLKLYLKGTVIYPAMTFSIPCLDFGEISIGVPETLEVDVINESVVDVSGTLKISSDGPEISSITLEDCGVEENPQLEFPQWPKEFNIEPSKISLGPQSRFTLQVTLTANLIRANQTYLELELEKSDSPPIVLPVTFQAMVPEITPAPDIYLRVCFIDYPYVQEVTISANHFYGYFFIEEPEEESDLKVDIGIKRGLIKPDTAITFPVTLSTSVVGLHEFTIRMYLFGMKKPIDICHITVHGVRPIVTCAPTSLHWGQVKLLTKSSKILTLCNDSPVEVHYSNSMVNRDESWVVVPAEGSIPPEGEAELTVTIYLVDADTYQNKVLIHLEKVKDIMIPLTATGVGTSIVVGEHRDKILLGRHFTKLPLKCTVVMQNYGTRVHALEWSEFFKPPKTKIIMAPFFNLEPRLFKMGPGEKIILTISGLSPKAAHIQDIWYLIGSVEGVNKKELLMQCAVNAEFVDPKIEVSATNINLQYDNGPYSEFYKLTDVLSVKNVSLLPLDIEINTKPPFTIIRKQGTYKILSQDENMCGCIYYDESDLNMQNINQESGRSSKEYIDCLTYKTIDPPRKGKKLNFFEDINKIKKAFNLTHTVEERLEDQEVMKIQLLFDTTKHTNLRSRVYTDLTRIRFKGHTNKDTVKLTGKINFPNLMISHPRIDFRCILNGSFESKTIKIQNVTPLYVCYKLNFKKSSIISMKLPEILSIIDTPSADIKSTKQVEESSVDLNNVVCSGNGTPPVSEANSLEEELVPLNDTNSIVLPIQDIELDMEEEEENEIVITKEKIIKKLTPMLEPYYNNQFVWTSKLQRLVRYNVPFINDILILTPHRGLLKPNDVQFIHVMFLPTNNISVKALLEVEVMGGPSEFITITGQSSELMYKLNTEKLNFKIRSFHEKATENLIISNISQLSFKYVTYLNEPKLQHELEGIILDILPPEKVLEPDDEAKLNIVVRTGVVGYFNRKFLLQIGHLPHTQVDVFGWGVIPQVYLSLPRPDIANLPTLLGYRAIPMLTTEYLEAIGEIFSKSSEEHLNSPQPEKCFDDPLFQRDWHICSIWDKYPSLMDIQLAIERTLLVDYIKLKPDILKSYSSGVRNGPIPGFFTTPYVIDYGVVITGSTTTISTEIINYGPICLRLHFAKSTHPPSWLSLKLCGKLEPGESGKLDVTFSPTVLDFPELEQNVTTSFNIEVPYGVIIPVQVKALCAVPYLASNVTDIRFGPVRCGDKIECSISLKNIGRPTCIWYATLRLKAPGTVPMTVVNNSGKYEPGEEGWMSIAFKPTMEMTYEAMLIFRFHMNPIRLVIPVYGQGIMPHVHVIGPKMQFPPTLPWAETTDIYFGLTNPCPFPIELIIVHSDMKWKEDDEIYQLLNRFYNKPDEMLVPALKPGSGLPTSVINFYNYFKDRVKRAVDEEIAAATKIVNARPSAHAKKAGKSPKPPPPKGKDKNADKDKDAPPVRKFRTEVEIIADEIKIMKDEGIDPLGQNLYLDGGSSIDSEDKYNKGLIVVMHGSPNEEIQCQENAYSIGKRLHLPTINFDLCIVDAICVCEGDARSAILSAVNEVYEVSKTYNTRESSVFEDECFYENYEDQDDVFGMVQKKFDFVINMKTMATPRSKTIDTKKKNASSTGSHTTIAVLAPPGSLTIFQMDVLQELLIEYFSLPKYNRGFILDSLTSSIVKAPNLVLTTVLKCKPTIRNVNLILCQSDFAKWAQAYEDKLQREFEMDESQKVYTDEEIAEIIQQFEEMDADEYENSPPDLRLIYITHGLEERRSKFLAKQIFSDGGNITPSKRENKMGKVSGDSKPNLVVHASESKKKIKKEDPKAKPNPEYVLMLNRYNEYTKVTYEQLLLIASNWVFEENDLGIPLVTITGQLAGATQKKTKKKSEVQLAQSSEINFDNRGFPLTIITCPCLAYKEVLVNMLCLSPIVQEALRQEEQPDILSFPIIRKEYTVLLPRTMPVIAEEPSLQWFYLDESPIRKCECNPITDLNLVDDSTQDNVLNILSKWHCTCGKKVTSSQTSTNDIPPASVEKTVTEEESENSYPLPLRSVKSLSVHSGHIVLQPGDLVRCKYSFSPQFEGNFNLKRFVEVSGWPQSRVDINVSGICDLPRLDNRPKKMFENFVRRTLEDKVYKITYLDDQKIFEFGPIFVGSQRIYEEEYTIDLKNASLIRADVTIEIEEDTNIFRINKTFISLEPSERGKLTISAAPEYVGRHIVGLLFCVKDNPEIVKLNIVCSGVVPYVEILPETKEIDYGKHLLYRREDDRFIIKNDSILPIMWKLNNAEEFIEDFIIAKTTGVIPRNDNDVVPVTYIACNVGVIVDKTLIINIYDELGRGEPMIEDNLYFSAECYDVRVECAYENPNENFLNYGNVKVNSTVFREIYLMNKGKYNIYYKLKKVKNFPEPAFLKTFEAINEYGLLPPIPRLVPIEFECTPLTAMNLVNVPIYICSLLDGSKDQVVVAKFPVCCTIASFYNTFTLFPLGELNFHIIAVGSGVNRELILNNTSKCPFTYEIILPEEYQLTSDMPPPKPIVEKDKKGKDTKIKNPPLRCGNFLIKNEDNLLTPGTSRTIEIQFLATAPKKFEEIIHFIISDTCPAEAHGVPLKLVGTGAMPRLDFWNIETTFREHLVLKSLSEYKAPEPNPHCVFVEDSFALHFFCVTVNSSFTGSIDLYNDGLVSCFLTMKLHYQQNTDQDIIALDKYETHVEPLQHKMLGITFTPKALEEYRAVLEIRLKALHNQETNFKLCLVGEGVIPRIRLITPPPRQHKLAVLKFPVTCLGSICNKGIKFKNITKVKSIVHVQLLLPYQESRPVFWIKTEESCNNMIMESKENSMKLLMKPTEIAKLNMYFNPVKRGKCNCDVKINIEENPYEYFTVLCKAEAFIEDVILIGLEMLSMDADDDEFKFSGTATLNTTGSTTESKKKTKSAPVDKKKDTKKKRVSQASIKQSESTSFEPSTLKYVLDFGGCEMFTLQKRSVVMANNSEKVYKFTWTEVENIVIRPSMGYISPGEEKDIEIMFFSAQPVNISNELLDCLLIAISDDSLTMDGKGATWDNRQTITTFNRNTEVDVNERAEKAINEQFILPAEDLFGIINMAIMYSVSTEYTKYSSTLKETESLLDTYVFQIRSFTFKVENTGNVAMKISWSFHLDDEYPARIDKLMKKEKAGVPTPDDTETKDKLAENRDEASKETLFSCSAERDSVDTWFEVDLPFKIEPLKECLNPRESRTFKVTFSPQEAFDFKVLLKSSIDNLDPYDTNLTCKISAKSLIPYVHLDVEESDYLTSERRKVGGGIALSEHTVVVEFNVLGTGCYKKQINVVNPTNEAYDFMIEPVLSEESEDKPVVPVHCSDMKGFVEGGTSTEATFTFAPSATGVFESQWKFIIHSYHLTIPLLIVGIVREPSVAFVPAILLIRNNLVGFKSTNHVVLKNNENQSLNFKFMGDSLCNESGKTALELIPENGVLKPYSETPIQINYTPIQDGAILFKIFCKIQHLKKHLTLCVNSLSHLISPFVTYYTIGNEHVLKSDILTNIHLDQTASTYERNIIFQIKNEGSATFLFAWNYTSTPVKKYLTVRVEPKNGHVSPGDTVKCILYFTLKQVPVQSFPVTLNITDGPEYHIYLHAEIDRPLYHFSSHQIDFGKCIVDAPDTTYHKKLGFTNDDTELLSLALHFENLPELYVELLEEATIQPGTRMKIPIFFRPKEPKEYEIKLQFWVNSLCEETVVIKGQGVPLLLDLYEGCMKSFDLGPVKVGRKSVRQVEIINHSMVPIYAQFIFKDMYKLIALTGDIEAPCSEGTSMCLDPGPGTAISEIGPSGVKSELLYKQNLLNKQQVRDKNNALNSLKVMPEVCLIKPHQRVPIKIHFQPVGIISELNVQLNAKVLHFYRPLVALTGSATMMSLRLSQRTIQFGRVRKRGCRILKVLLMNEGNYKTKFCWQPLKTDEFSISPMQGDIAAKTNVTFNITFRPINNNPFVKVWASCNIENYKSLELVLHATCLDTGVLQTRTLYLECPVREETTEFIVVTNPTDENWLIVSEISENGPFETLREFTVEPNSTFEIPVHFKPRTMGKYENQVLFSPLGETALFVTLLAAAVFPNPNDTLTVTVTAKDQYANVFPVYNITEEPEEYIVTSEVASTVPPKFDGYYEIKHSDTVKVWGEAKASCRWTFICFEPCEMLVKVMFINRETREYQYYVMNITVNQCEIVDTLKFVSRARESVQKELLIRNPLGEDSTFVISGNQLEYPDTLMITRNSQATLVVTYSPLVVGEGEEYLYIQNPLVGSYVYKVNLICTPAKEKDMEFATCLGESIPMRLRVQNRTDAATVFTSSITHPSILLDPQYPLGPNAKGKFLVWFEPTELGVQHCRVSFNSPTAGEFVFNIKGLAKEPKPQGPYEIAAGGSTTIKFKNVFDDTRTFKIFVDKEEFFVKTLYEPIKPKKDMKVIVYLNDIPRSEMPTGCLTIECYEPEQPHVQWTYFLHGI